MENQLASKQSDEDGISLLDLALALGKNKKLLWKSPLTAGILAAGISLLFPNIYTATTSILPPQQNGASAMLAQLSGLASLAGAGDLKNPGDLYVGMLQSRTVADNLINRFKLMEHYDKETLVDTRKKLEKYTSIASGKDSIIDIEFDDPDPQFAADVANGYVEELYNLTKVLAVTEASQRRLFFERQLNQAKDNLDRAQLAAKESINQDGVSNIDVDSQLALQTAANLRAQITAQEIQIGAMRTFAADQNPQLQMAQQQLIALKQQLSQVEGKRGANDNDTEANKRRFDSLQRIRDVKYYETLYILLAKQFEMAKIDEAKNATLIQVLDKAVVLDKKSKPKRAIIVLVVMVLTILLTALWIFVRESISKAKDDPKNTEKFETLTSYWAWRK